MTPTVAIMRATVTNHAGVTVRATATLTYQAADPWTITMDLRHKATAVTWHFARDILTDGLRRPTGAGDVTVWPSAGGDLGIVLRSPDGVCLVEMSHTKIARFLRRTYAAVPAGAEAIDFDATITAILDGVR